MVSFDIFNDITEAELKKWNHHKNVKKQGDLPLQGRQNLKLKISAESKTQFRKKEKHQMVVHVTDLAHGFRQLWYCEVPHFTKPWKGDIPNSSAQDQKKKGKMN